MYFSPRSGAAIGLHVGYVCGAVADSCFNFGLRFDASLLTLIAAVAADGSSDRPIMASAELSPPAYLYASAALP